MRHGPARYGVLALAGQRSSVRRHPEVRCGGFLEEHAAPLGAFFQAAREVHGLAQPVHQRRPLLYGDHPAEGQRPGAPRAYPQEAIAETVQYHGATHEVSQVVLGAVDNQRNVRARRRQVRTQAVVRQRLPVPGVAQLGGEGVALALAHLQHLGKLGLYQQQALILHAGVGDDYPSALPARTGVAHHIDEAFAASQPSVGIRIAAPVRVHVAEHRPNLVQTAALARARGADDAHKEIQGMPGSAVHPVRTRADDVTEGGQRLHHQRRGIGLGVRLDGAHDVTGQAEKGFGLQRLRPLRPRRRFSFLLGHTPLAADLVPLFIRHRAPGGHALHQRLDRHGPQLLALEPDHLVSDRIRCGWLQQSQVGTVLLEFGHRPLAQAYAVGILQHVGAKEPSDRLVVLLIVLQRALGHDPARATVLHTTEGLEVIGREKMGAVF